MRETPEAPHDVAVSFGMRQIRLPEAPIERSEGSWLATSSEWPNGR